MKRNDPDTGKFTKGNPGRPKGSRNERTLQWEELGKEITERNAAKFNDLLGRLWENRDVSVQVKAAELFLRSLEFFRPKLQRIQTPVEQPPLYPPLVVENGKATIPDNWPGPVIRIHRHIIGQPPITGPNVINFAPNQVDP